MDLTTYIHQNANDLMAENCSIRLSRIWTLSDKKQLAKIYPNTPTDMIAKRINRSAASVTHQAFILGLKRSDQFIHNNKPAE
jgi:hypothetical protein